jgi:hypothetical protein
MDHQSWDIPHFWTAQRVFSSMGDFSFAGQSTYGGGKLRFCAPGMRRKQPPTPYEWVHFKVDRTRYRLIGCKRRGDLVVFTQKTRNEIGRWAVLYSLLLAQVPKVLYFAPSLKHFIHFMSSFHNKCKQIWHKIKLSTYFLQFTIYYSTHLI